MSIILVQSYFHFPGCPPEEFSYQPSEITREILTKCGVEKLGKVTKLFFDYDRDMDNVDPVIIEEERRSMRYRLMEHSLHYKNGFVFTESTQPDKISFHIIFKRHVIVRATFTPELERELIDTIFGADHFKYIDPLVYSEKLWFRGPYCTVHYKSKDKEKEKEKSKPYPHIPHEHCKDLSDFMITVDDDTDTTSYDLHPFMINKRYHELANQYHQASNEDEEDNLSARQERITEYLTLIKPERFVAHKEWFQLMCICRANVIPLHYFLDLSQKSGYTKFNRESCTKQFNALEPRKTFGFPLLHKWLEEDGIDWKKLYPGLSPIVRAIKNLESNDFGCTDMGVAGVIHEFYKGSLYYTKTHGWLYWNDAKWDIGDDSMIFYPICKRITGELFLYIKTQMDKKENAFLDAFNLPKDDVEGRSFIPTLKLAFEQCKDAFKRYRHLQSVASMKSVLQMSMSLFRDDAILDTFDCQPHLFSFTDKSINLLTHEIVPFTKEQRILTTCGYDMPEKIEANMTLVKTIINSITDSYDAFIANMAITMYGGNINEAFLVWKGIGRNGKGVTDTLLRKVLGKYMMTLPINELTQESKGKGGTNSEIANLRFARCVMSVEPEENQKLQTGRIKQLTGNDPIDARQLYKEAFKFLPKFTLLLQCNALPRLTKLDDAIENRMLVTEFPFQFVETVLYEEYQRKVDTSIKGKLSNDNSYRDGMLWIMLDSYKETQGKIIRTEKHKEQLMEIIEDNSPLAEFLEEYELSVNFVRINELFEEYNQKMFTKFKKSEFKKCITNLPRIKCEEDKAHGMKIFLKKK